MKLDFDKVYLLAAKHCWSIPDLSVKAGISSATLYNSRTRDKVINNKTVGKIARALGCEPQEILLQE